jgi:hydroxymethylpyrimidine/phosphomethylpyrimidine kinase
MPEAPPVALTIAGSDCSAGAGVQADLKTFTALGCYGLTALTSVVAEVPAKVERIQNLDAEMITAQIEVLARSFSIRAMKTGMLGGRAQIEGVLRGLEHDGLRGIPLLVDPVMVATSGRRLLDEEAMELLTGQLFQRATLITPNLDEAAVLSGNRPGTRAEMEECGRLLAARYGCAALIKGGHLSGEAADVLVEKDEAHWFEGRRIAGVHTHGTGCTLSAAITAGMCHGLSLWEAIEQAKTFVAAAIAVHFRWETEDGVVDALNHQVQDALQAEASMLSSGLIL